MSSSKAKTELKNLDVNELHTAYENQNEKVTNTSTILLVIFVLIIVSLLCAFILYLVFGTDMLIDKSGNVFTGLVCDKANLIDASTAPCCSTNNFNVTDIRYLSDINMTVGTNPVDYRSVCRGYCSKFTGSGCEDPDEDQDYQKCISNLMPVNCTGLAMPVAQIGSQKYYGQNAGYQVSYNCATQCICARSTCQPVN